MLNYKVNDMALQGKYKNAYLDIEKGQETLENYTKERELVVAILKECEILGFRERLETETQKVGIKKNTGESIECSDWILHQIG